MIYGLLVAKGRTMSDSPYDADFWAQLVDRIKQHVAKTVEDATRPLKKEIVELRRKVAELESKGIEFKGVYQRACAYERGSIVSYDGHMWACITNAAVNEQPGQSDAWCLAVRRGRDSREHDRQRRPHDGKDAA